LTRICYWRITIRRIRRVLRGRRVTGRIISPSIIPIWRGWSHRWTISIRRRVWTRRSLSV
jgi:hypothetical protein